MSSIPVFRLVRTGLGVPFVAGIAWLAVVAARKWPVGSSDFMPHGYCYLWDPGILWLNVISDGLIALSYYAIPVILIYFIRKNHELPFGRIFWMFGTFILACGTTHLMEIWNVWHGSYMLAGVLKGVTAAVSLLTAGMLIPLVPHVISVPERVQLQSANRELEREIAERQQAEQIVRDTLAASGAVLEELADQKFALDQHAIVATTNVQGSITYVNEKFCAISQYSKDELIGQNHRILNSGHHPREFFQKMYHTIANGDVWRGEICNRAKDGSSYWVDTTIVPFLDSDGKPRQYMAIRADITERKRAEEEVRRLNDELEGRVVQRTEQLAAANHEMEAFTYSVSHDLRAPLRHISGFSKLLSEEFGAALPPEGHHMLERIQEGTRRMGLLVDDLLNLGRIGRHEVRLQITGLNSLVAETIADLKPECEGRQVEWRIGSLPFVECDPGLMRQVLRNLLSNAVKFTRHCAQAVIEVGQKEEESGAPVVFVRDNGVGFDIKYADKLFGVFQRLHRQEDFEGTGVGLATVQRIVQKHGGRIWAEAELGKGASFYFTVGGSEKIEIRSKATFVGEKA